MAPVGKNLRAAMADAIVALLKVDIENARRLLCVRRAELIAAGVPTAPTDEARAARSRHEIQCLVDQLRQDCALMSTLAPNWCSRQSLLFSIMLLALLV